MPFAPCPRPALPWRSAPIRTRVLRCWFPLLLALALLVAPLAALSPQPAHAATSEIVGPPGSEAFGQSVTILPNGNLVVTDPKYDLPGPIVDVGAVYLYDGATLALISTLTGSSAGDQVGGFAGVSVLANGNFVVSSTDWDNGAAVNAGAVTWGSAVSGVSGVVNAANSLVGSTSGDRVGSGGDITSFGIYTLENGNYLVNSPSWSNGAADNAGAVTWGDGTTGVTGVVSAANSLVGSSANDQVGTEGIVKLTNGNYVVRSAYWDNGAVIDVGAATWGSGTTGVVGVVSAANSLVGASVADRIGASGVLTLTNGNYIVTSERWDNGPATDAGAVSWGNGTTGVTGPVSAANSLVGSTADERVGWAMVLTNGNYVVSVPGWDNGSTINVGAVTWANGATGLTGPVSPANSLIGTSAGDNVGAAGVVALPNGNYVVGSPYWKNGTAIDAGAVTWASGAGGLTGPVTSSNSLVGSSANDQIGDAISPGRIIALTNSNYVVVSPRWNNGAVADAGAVTWGSGTGGTVGPVSAANSLVGTSTNEQTGVGDVTALANGNYVVNSPYWKNGAVGNAGAVTWGSGTAGVHGPISSANSLVGSSPDDGVYNSVIGLANGNYLVTSSSWDNGKVVDAGAVTWGSGTAGVAGAVSAANSLVGSTANDLVGGVTALANGNYVVASPGWDNGKVADVGAVTWGSGTSGVRGPVSSGNSLVGSRAGDSVSSVGGQSGVVPLANGDYVVVSRLWTNGQATGAGAVTLGNGLGGSRGPVSRTNSLVGSAGDQHIGAYDLNNGDVWLNGVAPYGSSGYWVYSPGWSSGSQQGAVSVADRCTRLTGPITGGNSILDVKLDSFPYDGQYDAHNGQLIISLPRSNKLVIWRTCDSLLSDVLFLPSILR